MSAEPWVPVLLPPKETCSSCGYHFLDGHHDLAACTARLHPERLTDAERARWAAHVAADPRRA